MKLYLALIVLCISVIYAPKSVAENNTYCASDCKYEIRMFRKYMKQGSSLAELSLGIMYIQGKGINKNIEAGIRHISQAVKDGEPAAYYQLGYMYMFGMYVEQDLEKAKNLLTRAKNRYVNGASKYLSLIEKYESGGVNDINLKSVMSQRQSQKELAKLERAKAMALSGDVEVIRISGDFDYTHVVEAAKMQSCTTETCSPQWSFVLLPMIKLTDSVEKIIFGKAAVFYQPMATQTA